MKHEPDNSTSAEGADISSSIACPPHAKNMAAVVNSSEQSGPVTSRFHLSLQTFGSLPVVSCRLNQWEVFHMYIA
jgi:hypothetical protein